MPIYEYACRSCAHRFELLIRGTSATPACPACKSGDLEKLLSLPAVKSESTHALAMKAAKKRDSRQANERVNTQREYEANHDNE
jgi:putative FmdB family regulatory protein